jgi:hypothetical protein
MKTATKDLFGLDAFGKGQSTTINFSRSNYSILDGSVNIIKVDYPIWIFDRNLYYLIMYDVYYFFRSIAGFSGLVIK